MTRSLRVLVAVVIVAAMAYGAALTLALTGNLGSTTAIVAVVAGAVLLPIALFILRRRFWSPLGALRRGIQQVAEGDLTTEVPVDRDDEPGNITAHFNQMTRVLRDRAEEQGRFAAAGELLGGVAHEVNNPLMAIASHAELRLADANLPAEQPNEMQSILLHAQREGPRPPPAHRRFLHGRHRWAGVRHRHGQRARGGARDRATAISPLREHKRDARHGSGTLHLASAGAGSPGGARRGEAFRTG